MGTLEKALPGRQNAKDWLTLKIVECMAEPMDERVAGRLETYNAAYNAICQWSESDDASVEAPGQIRTLEAGGRDLTDQEAKMWTSNMQNVDGTNGPHWTLDQAKQVMTQRGINCNPAEFWVALNIIYSDYCKVAKKHNVGNSIDFYADMAKAFLDDKDAGPDKLVKYYQFVVKH